MRPNKINSVDLEVIELLKNNFLTRKQLKDYYGTDGRVNNVIYKLSEFVPLYSDKIENQVCYKILTEQDIENYFKNQKKQVLTAVGRTNTSLVRTD